MFTSIAAGGFRWANLTNRGPENDVKPLVNSPNPHVAKKISVERLLRLHLEIYEYAPCNELKFSSQKRQGWSANLSRMGRDSTPVRAYSGIDRGTWCANLIDCIKKTYGRNGGLGIRICTIAEAGFSWKRKSLDGGRQFSSEVFPDLRWWMDGCGPLVGCRCGEIEVERAGGTPALVEGMQDFGVLAFNGWDGFQDVVSEFLGFVDWRCGTELDFADDGLFSGGK